MRIVYSHNVPPPPPQMVQPRQTKDGIKSIERELASDVPKLRAGRQGQTSRQAHDHNRWAGQTWRRQKWHVWHEWRAACAFDVQAKARQAGMQSIAAVRDLWRPGWRDDEIDEDSSETTAAREFWRPGWRDDETDDD